MKTVVILPTYNEKENIRLLIHEIERQFKKLGQGNQILVVDDTSPDGTAEAVQELKKTLKNLDLIEGQKKGLGYAYIRGMRYAIDQLGADVVVEMDADFSHLPADLPRLIKEIENGYDLVLGSRYIRGGKLPDNWSLLRKANSKWGNRFARRIAGIHGIADCTTGFRAISVALLKKIDLNRLKVRGYSFQMNLLFEAFMLGAKIKEIPIEFEERRAGKSKIGIFDVGEFIYNSFLLFFRRFGLNRRSF